MPSNPMLIIGLLYIIKMQNGSNGPLITPLALSSALSEAQRLLDTIDRLSGLTSQLGGLLQDSNSLSSIKNMLEIVEKSNL